MSDFPPGFIPDAEDGPPKRPSKPSSAPTSPAVVVHETHHNYGVTLKQAGLGCVGAVLAVAFVCIASLLIIAATHTPKPNPTPRPDAHAGVKVGRQLAPIVVESLAKGFDREAELLEQGKSVGDANKALRDTDDAERQTGFAKVGAPFLEKIVPDGKEPENDAKRKEFAEAHRKIAEGLREGKK